ncbi:GTP-binding protein [Kocuria palustris]|nr:GTP-binding protein [Kocuria palustris]
MGLLSIIRAQKLKDRELRVLVLGLDNAGKTTVVKYLLNDPLATLPTMGFAIDTLTREDSTIHFWDVGGQKSLRPFWGNYFEHTDVVVWVVDAASVERVQELAQELNELRDTKRLVGVRVVVVVNKVDLLPPQQRAEVVPRVEALFGDDVTTVVASAKTGENLDRVLEAILEDHYNMI